MDSAPDYPPPKLMALPAEIREQIWLHAVTEWTAAEPKHDEGGRRILPMLQKAPIRMDRLNRPLPSPLTRVSKQVRAETLQLYYSENIFECWRPLEYHHDWSSSTFIGWLTVLGPEKVQCLNHVLLLYKQEGEPAAFDIEDVLEELGFYLKPGVINHRRELSEYEMCYEQLGLPRHFGPRRNNRWTVGRAASS